MKKNICIVFGLTNYRKKFLSKLNKEHRDVNNIYITADDIFSAIDIVKNRAENIIKDSSRIYDFIVKNNSTHYIINRDQHQKCINEFYRSISTNTGTDINFLKQNITTESAEYLLSEFSRFLFNNSERLSISSTLTKRENYQNIRNNNKLNNLNESRKINKYKDYKAGFLAKNVGFNINNFNGHLQNRSIGAHYEGDEKLSDELFCPKRPSKEFTDHSFYRNYNIGQKEYTKKAFSAFLDSDKAGFSYMKILEDEIYDKNMKNNSNISPSEYEFILQGRLIRKSFERAFIRKLSKLSIDWLENEADKTNSPIKEIIIYMEDVPPLRNNVPILSNSKDKKICTYNIDPNNFHHKWRNSDYKDIENYSSHSLITHSEVRHALKIMETKRNHHIKLIYADKFASAKSIFDNL
ncbi:MAG: hypothetical protein LBI71_11175 [Enterobacteriaceae bacterium]|jgi:hypothetical protein|nr:hypothetical protein [Enterobacteriaceae bacterium]